MIDVGFLDKSQKDKIQKFAEIRNQFAHNLEIREIDDCNVEMLTALKKRYATSTDSATVSYFNLYKRLYYDIHKIVAKLHENIFQRIFKKVMKQAPTR